MVASISKAYPLQNRKHALKYNKQTRLVKTVSVFLQLFVKFFVRYLTNQKLSNCDNNALKDLTLEPLD